MDRYCYFIMKHKKSVIFVFFLLTLMSTIFAMLVGVNYDLGDYLPKEAQSTTAITVMEGAFGSDFPNARAMISNVSIQEALEYKKRIGEIEGVSSVTWLDDAVGIQTLLTIPVEFLDPAIVKNYLIDNNALMTISIEGGQEQNAVRALRNLIGPDNALAGDSINTATTQEMSFSEVIKAMIILLPIIIIILILSTTSWVEPLLFLISIGVAVLLNLGTNILFGEISFITQTISPILQLAVSLDYAIFLMHSFNEYKMTLAPQEAMVQAMKKVFSTVGASAATTVVGFLALTFMRFGIGFDLGLNLVKGVLLSFISVMVLMPALVLVCHRLVDQTRHSRLIPDFRGAGRWLMKIRIPFFILALFIVIPSFLAQSNIEFQYGTGGVTGVSRAGKDNALIEEQFGKENQLALLVPRGDTGKELELCHDLAEIPRVKTVISYVTSVGAEIPYEYVPNEVVNQFYSEDFARMILYTNMPEEGSESFNTVKAVLDTAAKYYPEYYLAGQSATLYDMKNIVSKDTRLVNMIAIIGIFIVLLLTFKSCSIPVILLFTIETAIWINLSFAYFSGQSFNFIGYLVISTVQLGATVDYAILLTDRYLNSRRELPKTEAMKETLDRNLMTVLISSSILATAGFTLGLTSSNPVIAELGTLMGRGTLFSLTMVVCVLPALLVLFDGAIQRTTLVNLSNKISSKE